MGFPYVQYVPPALSAADLQKLRRIYTREHAPQQWYGENGGVADRDIINTGFTIESGGLGAYGTEVEIHDGTVIEGGDSSKYMSLENFLATGCSAGPETPYRFQLWHGTGLFADAELWSEVDYEASGTTVTFTTEPIPCNHKIWVRVRQAALGVEEATIQYGVRIYEE